MASIPNSQAPNMSTKNCDVCKEPTNDQSAKCPKHEHQILNMLCRDCCQLICEICLLAHSGHDIQRLSDDPKIFQKVCSRQIQHLLDELHEAEDTKSVFESMITVYDDASVVVDKWELDLLQMVKTKAAQLRQKIKEIQNDKSALLSDRVNGLITTIHEIDQTICKLTDIRKSTDVHLLSIELAKSQSFISELESCNEDLRSQPSIPSLEKILPNDNKFKEIEKDIDAIFSSAGIDIPITVNEVASNQSQTSIVKLPGSEMAQLMTPGTRVERGDDWMWRSHDGYPHHVGIVTCGVDEDGWVFVKWDNGGEYKYCMGAMGRYELKLA